MKTQTEEIFVINYPLQDEYLSITRVAEEWAKEGCYTYTKEILQDMHRHMDGMKNSKPKEMEDFYSKVIDKD